MKKGLVIIFLFFLFLSIAQAGQEKVDINTASKEVIRTLPGIGPVTAQAIIDGRPYATINGLTKVRGIGTRTVERLKNFITVGEGAPVPRVPAGETPAKININTATLSELQTLPGVGPTRARAIIDARPYYRINDLTRAKRFGTKTVENLRALITVGEVAGEPASREKRRININLASQQDLESLSGIGPKTAQRIIEYRPYRIIADIQDVPRIGPKTYEKLKDFITVEKPDINRITYRELAAIPNVGPEIARFLIEYRANSGPFKRMREVRNVPGMDDEIYQLFKSHFSIGKR